MSSLLFLQRRNSQLGPEPPEVIAAKAADVIKQSAWVLHIVEGLAAAASGLVVLFLVFVFVWRRSLADRVSLRIVFAISVLDCIGNAVQTTPPDRAHANAGCRAFGFFLHFSVFTSICLSSSIATNLYMVFLRNNKSPASTYIKRFYFIVPAAVGLVHSMPQYVWAALQGYCTASDPMARGTKEYQVYVVFALLFLPWLFMLFNVVICTWVITWLVIKQRQMNWSLEYIRNRRELILQSSQQFTAISKYDLAMIDEYERQLKVRSKINSSAFRIALYPLAPLVWCIIMTVHTAMLFGVTMTYESDIETLAKAQKLAWLSYPATTLLNFLVFLSDPVMLDVIGEVCESVMAKCSSRSDFAEIESQQGCDANSDMPLDEPTVTDQEYSSEKQSTQPGAAGVQYRRNVRNSMYQVIDSARRRDNVYNEAILAEI